jgi:hypothetical protein
MNLKDLSSQRSVLAQLHSQKTLNKYPKTSCLKSIQKEDKVSFSYSDLEPWLVNTLLVDRILDRIQSPSNGGSEVMRRMQDLELKARDAL